MTHLSSFKRRILASVGSVLLACTILPPALAQTGEIDALEARIDALESVIEELRAEVDAARQASATTEDRIVRIEQRAETGAPATAPSGPAADGFQVGNTRIAMGGFVDADYHVTDFTDGEIASESIARDFYIPGAIPVGGSGDSEPDSDFTAQGSRFFLTSTTPTGNGDITGRIELDFLGSPGGDERVSNSYNPRLRVAWLEHRGWRFGQDWSTFQNTSSIPESASFLIASDGMIFIRQPQLRYTYGNWQFALENPDTTVTPFGGGARINADDGSVPDVVARYNWTGDFGNVSFAGIYRNLNYEGPGVDGSTTGWGLSAAGSIKLSEGSDIRFSLTGGEGVGRYIGLNAVNGAVVTAGGDIEAIPSWGGLIAWRQSLGAGRRFNIGYSFLEADNDVALTGSLETRSVYSGFANYMFDLAPGVTIGAEILFGERELEDGQTGSMTRATLSTKYTF